MVKKNADFDRTTKTKTKPVFSGPMLCFVFVVDVVLFSFRCCFWGGGLVLFCFLLCVGFCCVCGGGCMRACVCACACHDVCVYVRACVRVCVCADFTKSGLVAIRLTSSSYILTLV